MRLPIRQSSRRHWRRRVLLRNGALFVNHALASVVCLKRWSVKNGAQGVAPFVPNDGRFWAVALRLVKRVGYGRTILGVRYKRDSVPERMLRHPTACQERWSVQNDGRASRRFWAEGLRLVKRVGYGRTILGVRYKRDSVLNGRSGVPSFVPNGGRSRPMVGRPSFF